MTSDAAIEAGARAIHASVNSQHGTTPSWDDCGPNWKRSYIENARAAYAAMAPLVRAELLDGLTAHSPRLPDGLRDLVFEAAGDIINKFGFPVQNMGDLPGVVEFGDVCGEVEKRIVALLRARAVAEGYRRG